MTNGCQYRLTSFHKEVTEVLGSSHLLTIEYPDGYSANFLIDCGMSFEISERDFNFDFDPKEIDAVFLTHCHQDHIGLVPMLYKKGYRGYFYIASPNVEFGILRTALLDLAESHDKRDSVIAYPHRIIYECLNKVKAVDYGENFKVKLGASKHHEQIPRITVTFNLNGHLPGAASIEFISSHLGNKRRIIFSGDYKPSNKYLPSSNLGTKMKVAIPTDVVIESTYATKEKNVEGEAKEFILNSINARKSLMISAFTNFRMEQVLNTIKECKEEHLIPSNTKVLIHSELAEAYFRIYKQAGLFQESIGDFYPYKIQFVKTRAMKNYILNRIGKEPFILLTSGSSVSIGTMQIYLSRFLESKKAAVMFSTSYLFKSPILQELYDFSIAMKNSKDAIVLSNYFEFPIAADILFAGEYSMHATGPELLSQLKKISKLQNVFVNHGSEENKQFLADMIDETFAGSVRTFIEDRLVTHVVNNKGKVEVIRPEA